MSSNQKPTRLVVDPQKQEPKLPALFRILLVLFLVLIVRFVFMLFFLNYISQFQDSSYYASFLYVGITIITFVSLMLGIPLGYLMVHSLEGTKFNEHVSKNKSIINPFSAYQKSEGQVSGSSYGILTLVLIGLLLYFLFYLPLDILFNLIPGVLSYQSISLSQSPGGEFYSANFDIFIVNAVVVHLCVGIWEEAYFRYFLGNLNDIETDRKTAIITTSLAFGLVHFYYIFRFPQGPIFPIIWGLAGISMAFISITVYYKYRSLIPVIVGHALNNILASYAVRQNIFGGDFLSIFLNYYVYLIAIAGILFIVSIKFILEELPKYLEFVKKVMNSVAGMKWYYMILLAIVVSLLSSLFF